MATMIVVATTSQKRGEDKKLLGPAIIPIMIAGMTAGKVQKKWQRGPSRAHSYDRTDAADPAWFFRNLSYDETI
jgi:hypothetical protein